MTVGACQQMIKGVSGRCHSLSCITNLLLPTLKSLCYAIQFKNGDLRGAKIKNEERRSVYSEGDTASVDWRGLGFGGFLLLLFLFICVV